MNSGNEIDVPNKSGKEIHSVPPEARQISVAALLWGPAWGLRYKLWWTGLGLIPMLSPIIHIVLLFIGRRQAWDKGAWKNVDAMLSAEKLWLKAAIILGVCAMILGLVMGLYINPN